MKILCLALCLSTVALSGCSGLSRPVAQVAAEPGRTVRVPTTLTGSQGPASSLILGVQ